MSELIERLEAESADSFLQADKRSDLLVQAIERIKELEASPWISVEDRLPEDSGTYLVYKRLRKSAFAVVGFYRDEDGPDEMWIAPTHITHWMPIPELPK